jgi:thermostable 8-oxoguanine DNA glycosylase
MVDDERMDSAVAVMCWDNGGRRLVGLMIVRRADGHACFVEMPPDLEKLLTVIDVKFVEQHAAHLLAVAYEGLVDCEFEEDRVISREFLQQGFEPAVPGTMRHIPAERIASNPNGITTWEAAGFLVDVGEIDLARLRRGRILH